MGLDVVVDLLKAFEIEYVAINPGATFRGLHDSLVNYGGNHAPGIILCTHEEIAVALAHGYARAKGKPMGAAVHNVVGLQHASMAIYNAWADRLPDRNGRHRADGHGQSPPWIDWVHTALVQGNLVRDFVNGTISLPASRRYRILHPGLPAGDYRPHGTCLHLLRRRRAGKQLIAKSLSRRWIVILRRCHCKRRKRDSKKLLVGFSKRKSR